jgi:ATP-dependent helicase/nuclease subunit B
MSRTILIPPSFDLIAEVASVLKSGPQDFERNLVLFPGKRPAHFLRKELARRLGRACVPPRIFSIDTFIDYVYSLFPHNSSKDLPLLDAVAILHEVYLNTPGRFGGTSFDALESFLPLGQKLFAEMEEVKLANLPPSKLTEQLGGVTIGSLRPFSNAYEEFYARVQTLDYSTRATRYSHVADALTREVLKDFDNVIVAGFFALTKAERAIFMKLKESASVTFLYQEGMGIEKHIADLGMTPERPAGKAEQPSIAFYQSPDAHGQVFGLTGLIHKAIEAGAPLDEKTVVVLPAAETLLPVYHQTLAMLDEESYNISLGYPVRRTPVFGFLQNLLGCVSSMHQGKLYAPEYIRFILHPYTKNILFAHRPDITRILFHAVEEWLAGERSQTYLTLDDVEGNIGLFDDVAATAQAMGVECDGPLIRSHLKSIHDLTLRKTLAARTIGELAQACLDALMYIDAESTARRHPLFRRYVEVLIESLQSVRNAMLARTPVVDRARAATFLLSCLSDAEVPFPGTPLNGLQVLGFLETRNLRFSTVYLLDMNDDVIPGEGGKHTIIPQKLREHLGLPTTKDREDLAAYHLDVLIGGAKNVHMFFSDNAQKEKSRFVERLLWEKQQKDGTDTVDGYLQKIGYTIWLGNNTPVPIAKSPEMATYLRGFTYYATAIDAYLHCQLKFYYQYVLQLEELEEVAGEPGRSDVGSFVHIVLEKFFAERIGKPLSASMLDVRRLESIVNAEFPDYFGGEQTGARHLMQRQIIRQLTSFLENYQTKLCSGNAITLLELESKIRNMEKNGFRLSGKLDRVERRGDTIHILDYKTGSNESRLGIDFDELDLDLRESWYDAIGSLQLPLYMMLYSLSHNVPPEKIVASYLMLGKNTCDESIEVGLFENLEESRERYPVLEKLILRLLEEIANPALPFQPTQNLQENCPGCAFRTICGTNWVKNPGFY